MPPMPEPSPTPDAIPDSPDREESERLELALLDDVKAHAEDVFLRLLALLRVHPMRALLLIERYAQVTGRFVAEVQGAYEGGTKGSRPAPGNFVFQGDAATTNLITANNGGAFGGITVTQAPGPPDLRTVTGAMRDARALGDADLERTLRDRLDAMIGVAPTPPPPSVAPPAEGIPLSGPGSAPALAEGGTPVECAAPQPFSLAEDGIPVAGPALSIVGDTTT